MTILDTVDHDDWLADIRERLTTTRDELTAHLHELTSTIPDAADAADHAALVAAARQGLSHANDALRRIEQGNYGTCEVCGRAIPPERLAIVPHAKTCVTCKR